MQIEHKMFAWKTARVYYNSFTNFPAVPVFHPIIVWQVINSINIEMSCFNSQTTQLFPVTAVKPRSFKDNNTNNLIVQMLLIKR